MEVKPDDMNEKDNEEEHLIQFLSFIFLLLIVSDNDLKCVQTDDEVDFRDLSSSETVSISSPQFMSS